MLLIDDVLGFKIEKDVFKEIYFSTRYSIILRNVAKGEFSNVYIKVSSIKIPNYLIHIADQNFRQLCS